MPDERLRIVIEAKDNASAELKGLQNQLEGVGVAGKQGGQGVEKADEQIKKIKVSALAAAAVVAGMGVALWQLNKEGAQINALESRFTELAGSVENAAKYMRLIREETNYTISEMEAMRGVTKLLSMGLVDTAEKASELVAMAVRLGDQTQTAGERVNDFSLLLANQSVMRLDNFGISSGRVRQRIEELQEEFDGMTRETAFMNAVLDIGADSMDRMADASTNQLDSVQQLEASVEDLKGGFKKFVADALEPTIKNLAMVFTGMQKINDLYKEQEQQVIETGGSWEDYAATQLKMLTLQYSEQVVMGNIIQALDEMGVSYEQINEYAGDYNSAIATAISLGIPIADMLDRSAFLQRQLAGATSDTAVAFRQMTDAQQGLTQLEPNAEAVAEFKKGQDEIQLELRETELAGLHAASSIGEMSKAQLDQTFIKMLEDAGATAPIIAQAMVDLGIMTTEEMAIYDKMLTLAGKVAGGTETINNAIPIYKGYGDTVRESVQPQQDLNLAMFDTIEWVGMLTGDTEVLAGMMAEKKETVITYADAVRSAGTQAMFADSATKDLRASIDSLRSKQVIIDLTIKRRVEEAADAYNPETYNDLWNPPGNNANGTSNWGGGLTWVGERGPELVNLPRGAQVYDAQTSQAITNNNWNVNIHTAATSGTYMQDIELARAMAQ